MVSGFMLLLSPVVLGAATITGELLWPHLSLFTAVGWIGGWGGVWVSLAWLVGRTP